MRKLNILTAMAVTAIIVSGCTTIPVRPIAPGNTAELIGKWEGQRQTTSYTASVAMEIFNEKLEGKMTFERTASGTTIHPFNGKIEDEKLIIIFYGQPKAYRANLELRKNDRQMKLEGEYQWGSTRGTMSLKKVK